MLGQLLDTVPTPRDLHSFSVKELLRLADEVRSRIIEVLSTTGGHLSSNLGIVELTIALHRVFSSPTDCILFDVGHQAYTHKILTGRNRLLSSLRQTEGISGFTDPKESVHDHFYSGHAGNTLSLALGLAKQRDLQKATHYVLPVLGDASLTCGLTLEGLNNLPSVLKNFIVILNDNAMSISKNVGVIPTLLRGQSPGTARSFFEQFGFSYVGPIDGHDMEELLSALRAQKNQDKPVLLHVFTVKGKGMKTAMDKPIPYHGAKPFDPETGEFFASKKGGWTFPKVFGKEIRRLALIYPELVAITPATSVGSCIEPFMQEYPEKGIDVGIAEGHAVTYGAALAKGGKQKVISVVYSTFLQRAVDNIYHDVCIQNVPLILAIDRAGLATGDGVTAQGIYDLSFLYSMPNLVIVQPRDGTKLTLLLESSLHWNRPTAIRYPNFATTLDRETSLSPSEKTRESILGKGEILSEGDDVAIFALGHMHHVAFEVRKRLEKKGIGVLIVDPVFVKPLDTSLIAEVSKRVKLLATIEEHSLHGGFGAILSQFLHMQGIVLPLLQFGLPDQLIPHGSYGHLMKQFGLDPQTIEERIYRTFSTYFSCKSHDHCSFSQV